MRGKWCVVAATVVLLATVHSCPAEERPRCFFLECSGGDATPPAPPRPVSPAPPRGENGPRAQVPRRSSPFEVCQVVGGDHTYCVSSVLAPQYGFTYNPVNLTDGRLDTAWVEGVPGDGVGEWIVMIPAAGKKVLGFEILNGYHKNRELFIRNNRVNGLDVILPSGYRQTISLADQAGPQRFTFPSALSVEWIELRIKSVYRGTKYQDTAITELHLLTD